ncbi:helix-turn-helix domain-containing protein [Streptomyces incarnatus]
MRDGTPLTGDSGQRLRHLRTRAGLSQEALSHAAGVSVRALADMEHGRTRGPQRRTVQMLAGALGLDDTEAADLENSAAVGRPRPRTATGPAGPGTLALPRDIKDFTARGPALARLLELARDTGPDRPAVTVVTGQPGLGKTTFAVHAAHRLAPHFPDGQFALDLHGMDPEPTTPRDALARLLGAMGIADAAIPAGTDDRAGLWRSLAGDRRILLLLDNAVDESQVSPLLPGSGPALTIVTSRHSLAGLESVHRTGLALLRREEAVVPRGRPPADRQRPGRPGTLDRGRTPAPPGPLRLRRRPDARMGRPGPPRPGPRPQRPGPPGGPRDPAGRARRPHRTAQPTPDGGRRGTVGPGRGHGHDVRHGHRRCGRSRR